MTEMQEGGRRLLSGAAGLLPLLAPTVFDAIAAERYCARQDPWERRKGSSWTFVREMSRRRDSGYCENPSSCPSPEVVPRATNCPLIDRPSQAGLKIHELRASDALACNSFTQRLESHDLRMRFASLHYSINYLIPELAGVKSGAVLAAVDAAGEILGIVNLAYLGPDSAELAIIVRSDCKRRGIGRLLIAGAIQQARENGLSLIIGYVLAENKVALSFAQAMEFRFIRFDDLFVEVNFPVSSRSPQNHVAKSPPSFSG